MLIKEDANNHKRVYNKESRINLGRGYAEETQGYKLFYISVTHTNTAVFPNTAVRPKVSSVELETEGSPVYDAIST